MKVYDDIVRSGDTSADIRTCVETLVRQLERRDGFCTATVELVVRALGSSNAICRWRQIQLVRGPVSRLFYLSADMTTTLAVKLR